MTQSFRAALVALGVLALGTLVVWLLVGRNGGDADPDAWDPSPPPRAGTPGPSPDAPPPLARPGTSSGPASRPERPGDGRRGPGGTATSLVGYRVPEGVDLTDPEQVRTLLQQVLADRPTDWTTAAHLISLLDGSLEPDVRLRLLSELQTGDRTGALKAFGKARDGTLVRDLFDLLDGEQLSPGARRAVMTALATMPGANEAEVVRGLEARLEGTLREDALLLQAIGTRGGGEAARAIVEYLGRSDDPLGAPGHAFLRLDITNDPVAAKVIADALFQTGNAETLRALIKLAARPGASALVGPIAALDRDGLSEQVRMDAIRALADIGTIDAMTHVLKVASQPGAFGREALKSIGHVTSADAAARDALMKTLEDADEAADPGQTRLEVLRALGNLQHQPALKPFGEALKAPDPRLQEVAARGLGRLGPSASPYVEDLVDAFSRGDASLQRAVVLALGGIGGKDARGALLQMQANQELPPTVQRAVRLSLTRLGPAAAGTGSPPERLTGRGGR